ncbi:GNAT family N-acetyltransferase [Celerinatantimonas yamalensis]|uniref:N-acetyltransferase n=1 Tax=Celerinatantimonas yamalensis TaxID=559956 RepID=A0ABW9G940_9GAMM
MRSIASHPSWLTQLLSWPNDANELQLFAGPNLHWPLDIHQLVQSEQGGYARMLIEAKQLIGYCQLRPCRLQSVRLCRVIVHPDFRGQGIGRQLIAHAIQFSRDELGVRRIELGVYQHNLAAFNRYCYFGFKTYQQRRVKSLRGQDWVILDMQKWL